MKLHRFASHTPEERRRLSNLGHIVEGLLLGTVGLLALLGSFGIAPWASTLWPILILVAGVLLLLLIYPRHPLVDWPAIWRDAQQRQHTLMAMAIAVAGAALPKWGQSREPFDLSFKEKIVATYGIDFNAPPPGPAPEVFYDYHAN